MLEQNLWAIVERGRASYAYYPLTLDNCEANHRYCADMSNPHLSLHQPDQRVLTQAPLIGLGLRERVRAA